TVGADISEGALSIRRVPLQSTQPWAMFEYFAVVISPTEAKTRGPQPDLLTTTAVWTTQSDFGLCWPSITLDGALDDMDSKKLEAGKPTKTVERIAGPP